jgi:DNA processing protein
VIVVEANARSGALITARHAGEQGREVFAVPGPVDAPASAGCLELIRNGARLVRSADDVIEDLKGIATADYRESGVRSPEPAVRAESAPPPPPEPPPLPPLAPAEQRLYDALAGRRHADELTRELELPVAELTRLLMQLEIKKVVRRMPGNFYERR